MRKSVKDAIKTSLSDVTQLKFIGTFRPKIQNEFPACVISLPRADEKRASASAPIGKKRITYTAQLEIFTMDVTNDGSGALDFDDLLDAVDLALRKDVTLGGAVLSSTIEYIRTSVSNPQLVNGQTVALLAIKQFDVTVEVIG
jgi:hypothetical protein